MHITINPNQAGKQTKPVEVGALKRPAAYNSNTANVAYAKLEHPTAQCHSCLASLWIEERVQGSSKASPRFSICCKEVKVWQPQLHPPPEPLKTLLSSTTTDAATFRNKIRIYNSMFAFTSFGAQIDEDINKTRGPYTFRISGQKYHRIGSMIPESGKPPQYAQLYFCDTEIELNRRMGCMNLKPKDVDPDIVKKLIDMLDTHSCAAKAFRMARDWATNNEMTDFKLRLIAHRNPEMRQYNLPSVPEVAALIADDLGQSTAPRDICIHSRTQGPQRISKLHPLYMALQYPLLFPHGEDGFHEGIPYKETTSTRVTQRGHVTMREFYCYRLQQRQFESLALLQSGRLFHQYIVDAYTAVEEQRLRWIRFNQKELRADLYNNICDAFMQGDTEATSIGKRIILPATFTGSPRYMAQNYQDAMALCRTYGNPSLFITFTANPKWPEMSEMMSDFSWLTANDRPDLMTRLFKLKLSQLMDDLKEKEIFGALNAAIYTIEFQKRGLPHAHILLWLKSSNKSKTGNDIDEHICAEIPCKVGDPQGHKAVTDHMIHGPCGHYNKKASCMNNGECAKHFPKPFNPETTLDVEGFPNYKRRNNGVTVKKGGANVNNGYVVPYNCYLLLRYDAHINVEWCNQSRAIKYLFKYINKGPDKATVLISGNGESDAAKNTTATCIDEIKRFLLCRFISACEALWRLFRFDIHYSWPAVIRLSFHLLGQQSVTVTDSQSLADIIECESTKHSMFLAWFHLNKTDRDARLLTYAEVPQKYVWNASGRNWQPRKSQRPIGRIVYCHPAAGERYYLRMLLNVVKGPTSYEDLRTINGKLYTTYRGACYARGMLNDDDEWTDAISEAHVWATGAQLRELFVTILLFCEVSCPKKLWENTWEALSEDILYRKRQEFRFPNLELSENQIKTYCLLHIEENLSKHGKTLAEFDGLPIPDKSILTPMDNRLIQEELAYNTKEMEKEHGLLLRSLNSEQREIYKRVIKAVQQGAGGFFFVYGAGGTGKTHLYKTIMARIRSEGKIVLAVASSGIAALLLQGGRTAHSRFLIPLELMEGSTCGISQNSHLAKLIHKVELIIWDEAPMTQRYAFEALNRTLQDIMGIKNQTKRTSIFGGIPVLLGGDFRQILPVITKGRRQEIVQAAISNSPLWESCEVLYLTQSMRVVETSMTGEIDLERQEFNNWLRQVGDGVAPAI